MQTKETLPELYYTRWVNDSTSWHYLLRRTAGVARCLIARANLLNVWQLTLDLNEPAAMREYRRAQLPGLVKALVDAFES